MSNSTWTEADTALAEQIWTAYQNEHDLSSCMGKTAGIDPSTGRVWIGESIQDVLSQRNADGIDSLLFFERIGSNTYYRKGGRRLAHTSCSEAKGVQRDGDLIPSRGK